MFVHTGRPLAQGLCRADGPGDFCERGGSEVPFRPSMAVAGVTPEPPTDLSGDPHFFR